jgi:thiol-disulfide isomerase/thioredoxin
LFVSKFLKALIPPETHLPEPPKDADGNVTDREFLYRWYRAHFFDNLNIFDPEMLRMPFYEEKVMDYLTRVIPQHPDTICVETDKILAKAQANDEIFRCILVSVFNHYVSSKVIAHENVWVHLADKWYIPFAKWSADDYIEKLKKEVADRKPNLIGHLAPPIEMLMVLSPDHFKAAALDTAIKFDVHVGTQVQDFRKTMKSKYTVLYFWDYSCGHCKTGIQELHKVWEDLKDKGLQVITIQAISSREAKGKWVDFANEHNLFGWINAWCPYTYKYKELYNLSSFPSLYLLDEEHKIILKNIDPEQLRDIIAQR